MKTLGLLGFIGYILFFLGCSDVSEKGTLQQQEKFEWDTVAEKGYFPLKEGMTWKYRKIRRIAFLGEVESKLESVILPRQKLKGKWVIPCKSICEDLFGRMVNGYIYCGVDSGGIYAHAYQLPDSELKVLKERYYILKHPLRVGMTWRCKDKGHQSSLTVLSEEAVTVPAGTFERCLKVKEEGVRVEKVQSETYKIQVEGITWYAPGVGMVKAIGKMRNLTSGKQYKGIEEMMKRMGIPGMELSTEVEERYELISFSKR